VSVDTTSSFMTALVALQDLQRIDARRPPSGKVAGDQYDGAEDERRNREREWIMRIHT